MTALVEPRHRLRTPPGFAVVAALFYAIDGAIVHSAAFVRKPELLAAAVSFDLTLGVTLAYWIMVVRPGHAAVRTVLPVFLASIAAAAVTVPAGHLDLLSGLRYVAMPFELVMMGLIVLAVRASTRRLAAAGTELDVPERIRSALEGAVFPRAADVIATECAIFYYALAAWRRKPFVPGDAHAFSYHRKNGYAGSLYALVGVVAIETGVLDIALRAHHPHAANWLLGIDVFTVVWLFGFVRSVQLRPIVVTRDRLHVRLGLRWESDVALGDIASIAYGGRTARAKTTPGYLCIGPSPNVILTLRIPMDAHGPHGMRRRIDRVGLSLDDAKEFERVMRSNH